MARQTPSQPRRQSAEPRPAQPFANPFAPSTRLPEAKELNSDSAWNQFQDLSARHDAGFATTVPAVLSTPGGPAAQGTGSAPARAPAATLDQVMFESRRLNRVCPKPLQWVRLYALLPDRRPGQPPAPMHGRSWDETSSLGKRMVLRDQIEWAAARGGLDTVMAYLRSLSEEDWHHMGD